MPSTSIAQQQLMGMAYSLKKGDMDPKDASQEVKDLADSMTLQQLKDFASTKHKGLPDKVEEAKSNAKTISKDVWNKTNKDYKVIINGQKYVMEYDDSRDATILVPVIVENITPANIGGMGATLLPTTSQLGSGDILSGAGDAEEEYKKKKKKGMLKTFEQFINEMNESALDLPHGMEQFQIDERGEGKQADIYLANFTGRIFKAQLTDKTQDDGVPVTKNFTRGGYKDVNIKKGQHYIIEGDTFWYFRIGRTWYAVKRADYETPPFEY
jgi:hypothetical protein